MLTSLMGNSFLVLAVLVFVTVVLLLESLYVLWRSHRGPEATRLQTRLYALSATRDRTPQTRLLRQRMLSELPMLERFLQSVPRVGVLDRVLMQSGLNWTVSNVLLACLVLGGAGLTALLMGAHQSLLVSAAAGAVLGATPFMYVYYVRGKRMAKLERQLPEVFDLMIRALRAGHAFSAALKMAGEEMAEPVAGEFATVHDEVNFGVSLEQALGHLSERVPLMDLRYFVVAVLIQRESGGNLTEILGNLGRLVRERLKLMGKVRVLTSEGRMSAWILCLMPFFLAAVMNLANPKFMSPLWTDPIGIAIIKYTLGLMLIGIVLMRKIIKIRY
ncbi:MAG TPA: type II secretion system F family protein [Ramlibacter sp.]|nr:type II secretion system F family protein [Ramlibacter sp.]